MADIIDLSGNWQAWPDLMKHFSMEKAPTVAELDARLPSCPFELPGTTDSNRIGLALEPREILKNLHRRREFMGRLWLRRTIDIGDAAANRPLAFRFERVCWTSALFIDGVRAGSCDLLNAPHVYELPAGLPADEHELLLVFDNSNSARPWYSEAEADLLLLPDDPDPELRPPAPEAADAAAQRHRDLSSARSEKMWLHIGGHHTLFLMDTNWCGAIGRVELEVRERQFIRHLDIHALPDQSEAMLELELVNSEAADRMLLLQWTIAALDGGTGGGTGQQAVSLEAGRESRLRLPLDLAVRLRPWSDREPCLYRLELSLTSPLHAMPPQHHELIFGARELCADGHRLLLNGRRIFLRGTLEDHTFPLTLAPAMDEAWWERTLSTVRDYGLNHIRFHSWCPPAAALAAADRLGILLQAELPGSSCPEREETAAERDFLDRSLEALLREYGSHASFAFASMGNEQLVTSNRQVFEAHGAVLAARVAYAQTTDPRQLYTATSHPWTAGRPDDFYVSSWTPRGEQRRASWLCNGSWFQYESAEDGFLAGIRWGGSDPRLTSRWCRRRPNSLHSYDEGLTGTEAVFVAHELGQWAVFPDVREIPHYTGVLEATNLASIRERLRAHGQLGLSSDYVTASGALSARLMKAELETCLRSERLSGFQELRLFDYPGQGTSTVGLLNAFWQTKNLLSPAAHRRFCGDRVLLARFADYILTERSVLAVTVQLADYTGTALTGAGLGWRLVDQATGAAIAGGQLALAEPLVVTGPADLAEIAWQHWPAWSAPRALTLELRLSATAPDGEPVLVENSWPLWFFPTASPAAPAAESITVDSLADLAAALDHEPRIRFRFAADPDVRALPAVFTTTFWNPNMKRQVGTYGLLVRPEHPLLAGFPTAGHTDWQWWALLQGGRVADLTGLLLAAAGRQAAGEVPFATALPAQMIDSFVTTRILGLLAVVRVGRSVVVLDGAATPGTVAAPGGDESDATLRRLTEDGIIEAAAADDPVRSAWERLILMNLDTLGRLDLPEVTAEELLRALMGYGH
ncbi:MAG: hypothetical protein QM270_09935 [Bacillota bacterium]|nr:hypothetical protein [Bacillota bacterium]